MTLYLLLCSVLEDNKYKRGIMKTMSFRIEEYQNSLINELVEASGVKKSSIVRELLERGLEDMKHILVQK